MAPAPFPDRRRPLRDRPVTTLSDQELAAAVGDGEQAALGEVYRRHGAALYGLALRVLHRSDVAQEVVQEVLVGLWERPDRYDPERGALRPYLLRVTHGRAVDRLRSDLRRTRREEEHERDRPDADDDVDREVWELLRADTVRAAIQELSADERAAVELAYFGGHTYRDVAVLLDQPEGTVKSRIRTALRKLADRLEAAGLGVVADQHTPRRPERPAGPRP